MTVILFGTHKYQRPLSCQRRLIKRVILFNHQFLFFDFSSITSTPSCLDASLRWHDRGL
jgi:hypothetical protein